ncbi:1-(5-phosphoribosyl)-5-[(5-phosphoribosylamino)methylideneamino]imidazole-4-carboxamide isomerase [Ornithinibacillus xuwenensis]|uniref:1-(5-phosphoribosyl)-5-[(5-phosphoribosylamino)methylideneamino] imidazole-4-carboxamide isomerase n=1 Tax=Ornithinibacillus xuwenensis TaxID=3144668 RepID=A0ABU9XM35_9BACI
MILFPAIDILDGKCVRLVQGDYNQEKVYSDSPTDMAKRWISLGASALHIVDLDGAKTGKAFNQSVIQDIVMHTSIPIQVGGGIRTMEQMEAYLSIGVSRIILGTAAIDNLPLIQRAVRTYGNKIAVSIDARNGLVATEGWRQTSNIHALDLLKQLEQIGVETIIYTDIAKDGMLEGPNMKELEAINRASSIQVIASGGISSSSDIRGLKEMNLYGAIIGKALYDGTINFREVMED